MLGPAGPPLSATDIVAGGGEVGASGGGHDHFQEAVLQRRRKTGYQDGQHNVRLTVTSPAMVVTGACADMEERICV